MVVLRAIGNFFVKIGRWIRDTAWVQPLLIVGGIFAIIFSIPYITKWVQGWFTTGDAAVSFYKNNGYLKLSNGDDEGKNSDADKLLQFILSDDSEKTEEQYKKYGEKFFVTFVQEDCSTCSSIYKGWKTAKENWGKATGFKRVLDKDGNELYKAEKSDFKMYTIFVDQKNDDEKNYFWQLHDKTYPVQWGEISTLENPYSKNNSSISYDGLASSEEEDLSGGSVFTTPTTLLFDRTFAEKSAQELMDKGYACVNEGIANYKVSEIIFDIPEKSGQASGTPLARARTLWDCWNHIGQFCNSDEPDKAYISE